MKVAPGFGPELPKTRAISRKQPTPPQCGQVESRQYSSLLGRTLAKSSPLAHNP